MGSGGLEGLSKKEKRKNCGDGWEEGAGRGIGMINSDEKK